MITSRQPQFSRRVARLGATLVLLLTLLGSTAQAQITRTWDGGGADNNWSTPGNWSSNNVPDETGEAALFADGQTNLTPNLSASVTNGQLRFSATAPSYNITGTGASILYLSPAASFGGVGIIISNGAANQTISVAEVYFLTNQTWDIGGTTILTVSGTIEDAPSPDYALTKNGTGTLVFPGDVRYDGPTTVNAGTLVLNWNNTSMLSAFTVNAGTLRATTNNALGNNPPSPTRNNITLAGGALELANNTGLTFGSTSRRTTLTGDATIRSDRLTAGAGVTHTLGPLTIGAQTLSVTAGANVTNGTAGLTFGTTTITAGPASFDVASGANLTLGAVGGAFNLTKQDSGQLTLNTTGTRTTAAGTTTLTAGTLRLGTANALNTGASTLNLDGGTLSLGVTASASFNGANAVVGGTATVAVDRATSGATGPTHTLGTLSIGANTLNVVSGANINANNNYGLTFTTTTLTGDAIFNVANNGNGIGTLTLGVIGETSGSRALTKTGAGRLVLAGASANTYSGTTTVSAGTLALGATGSISSTPSIDVRGGCTLDVSTVSGGFVLQPAQTLLGNGNVVGNVTANGTVSPGASVGTLTFANNLALSGTTRMELDRNGGSFTNDLITASGLTYGGTLTITNIGAALQSGDTFDLFNWTSRSGSFSATSLPALSSGLGWDLSNLETSGTITVVTTVNTNPTSLAFAVVGNTLNISWPADHTGWRLEGQTNGIDVGINNNWFTVPGSTTTNQMILTINPANGASFFRLVYP